MRSQKFGQAVKVYPIDLKGYENGETPCSRQTYAAGAIRDDSRKAVSFTGSHRSEEGIKKE
jgi:hypothetical protein